MKRVFVILGLWLATSACRPEGELIRTVHEPHQRYFERQNLAEKKPADAKRTSALQKGLPPSCQTASQSPLCLQCQDEALIVYRCYDFMGPWNAAEECHYSQDSVKCLVKDPAFALHLEHRNSDEKFFNENLRTWVETVHQIWEDKLNPDEQIELNRIVQTLEVLNRTLTHKIEFDAKDRQTFEEAFGVTEPKTLINDFLTRMSEDRKTGRLKLGAVIEGLEELTRKTHGSAPLFEKFGTMSLEGLEDEN